MAKKASRKPAAANGQKVNKSQAIRDYVRGHRQAKPKEIVAALKEQGIDVLPNMASVVKAKMKIRRVKRQMNRAVATQDASAQSKSTNSHALDAVLVLYKAARGEKVPLKKVRESFVLLVESFG